MEHSKRHLRSQKAHLMAEDLSSADKCLNVVKSEKQTSQGHVHDILIFGLLSLITELAGFVICLCCICHQATIYRVPWHPALG